MTSSARPIATPSAFSGPFQRGTEASPRSPATIRMTRSTSGSRRAICCLAVMRAAPSRGGLTILADSVANLTRRERLRDQHDLASDVALGELGVGGGHLVERVRLRDRQLD